MNLLKTVTTVMLVTLWSLASHHCKLEQIPGFGFFVCCESENAAAHQQQDCEDDGCASVEGSLYKIEETQVKAVTPPVFPPLIVVALSLPVDLPGSACPLLADPPPELPVTWQFTERTALPPRAPTPFS